MALIRLPKLFLRKYGRVIFDLELYDYLNRKQTRTYGITNEIVNEGIEAQRSTMMKQLVKRLFLPGNGGQALNVSGMHFTIHSEGRVATFPPGIIDIAYFGSFPYSTNVTMHDVTGTVLYARHEYVGTGDPSARKKRFK